jgi:hypothetical protein
MSASIRTFHGILFPQVDDSQYWDHEQGNVLWFLIGNENDSGSNRKESRMGLDYGGLPSPFLGQSTGEKSWWGI